MTEYEYEKYMAVLDKIACSIMELNARLDKIAESHSFPPRPFIMGES